MARKKIVKSGKAVPATNRFVVSYRRAGKQGDPDKLKHARDRFERAFTSVFAKNVKVLSHNEEAEEEKRGIKIFDGDYLDVNAMKKDLPADLLVERLITRKPAVAMPFDVALSASQPLGKGKTLEFFAKDGNEPLAGISARVSFVTKDYPVGAGNNATDSRETDAAGRVVFEYDGSIWLPVGAVFEPKHSYWPPAPLASPVDSTIRFMRLPKTGPLGWWHQAVGLYAYDPSLGSGIRVGVVDTGVGPTALLSGVKSIGAFIDGRYDDNPEAGRDCANHGTHVCGILAASPPRGSNDYAGVVPGAEVCAARVFPENLNATQGDIANAIDALATEQRCHLINMSLGSEKPSEIELDAIRFAMEHGTLCICAAGNNNGGPVSFPAAYNETVAVSALGLTGMYPSGTLSDWFTPEATDKFGLGGFFLASYSNVGRAVVCCAPGTGIISTVPDGPGYTAAYLAMDGTSMSAPLATAVLAACLSRDEQYKTMPGNLDRFGYAVKITLAVSSNSVNLNPIYQGYGMTGFRPLV